MNPSLPRMDDRPYRVITTTEGNFVVCLQHRLTKEPVRLNEAIDLAYALNVEHATRMAL